MADKKVSSYPAIDAVDVDEPNLQSSTNKAAMSRALGAAFLNHQVEQLEKTVSSNGPASGNWRDRKAPNNGYGASKRAPNPPGAKIAQKKPPPPKDRKDKDFDRGIIAVHHRRVSDDQRDKDADVVVVDASVLIHALYQVKKWCRDGREEIVIVPLEGPYIWCHSTSQPS